MKLSKGLKRFLYLGFIFLASVLGGCATSNTDAPTFLENTQKASQERQRHEIVMGYPDPIEMFERAVIAKLEPEIARRYSTNKYLSPGSSIAGFEVFHSPKTVKTLLPDSPLAYEFMTTDLGPLIVNVEDRDKPVPPINISALGQRQTPIGPIQFRYIRYRSMIFGVHCLAFAQGNYALGGALKGYYCKSGEALPPPGNGTILPVDPFFR